MPSGLCSTFTALDPATGCTLVLGRDDAAWIDENEAALTDVIEVARTDEFEAARTEEFPMRGGGSPIPGSFLIFLL